MERRDYQRDENGWIHVVEGNDTLPEEPDTDLPVIWDAASREIWIDQNLRPYIVHIIGADTATLLHYAGDGWFVDDRGFKYKVDKWQELPAV